MSVRGIGAWTPGCPGGIDDSRNGSGWQAQNEQGTVFQASWTRPNRFPILGTLPETRFQSLEESSNWLPMIGTPATAGMADT